MELFFGYVILGILPPDTTSSDKKSHPQEPLIRTTKKMIHFPETQCNGMKHSERRSSQALVKKKKSQAQEYDTQDNCNVAAFCKALHFVIQE